MSDMHASEPFGGWRLVRGVRERQVQDPQNMTDTAIAPVVLGLQTRERAVFDQIRDVFDTDVQGTGRDDLGECRHRVLRSSKASIGLNARAAARRSSSAALTILSLG